MVSAWSIPQAQRGNVVSNDGVPGPAQYRTNKEIQMLKTAAPKFSIGNGVRSDLTSSETPSPAAYQLPIYLGKEGSKYLIGERRSVSREERERRNLPGPSAYSPKPQLTITTAPAFSIPGRGGQERRDDVPGPGNYEVNKSTMVNNQLTKMGNMSRKDLAGQRDIPGVGSYDLTKSSVTIQRRLPQFSIGSEERGGSIGGAGLAFVPGVGNYNTNLSQLSRIGGLMGTRASETRGDSVPGVGQYEVGDKQSSQNKFGKIGRELRQGMEGNTYTPSPQRYELSKAESFKLLNSPKFSIGTSLRPPLSTNESPGPVQYNAKEVWNSMRGVSMSSKNAIDYLPIAPGPQHYTPDFTKVQSKFAAYSSSKGAREGLVNLKYKAAIPGPADYRDYDVKMKKSPEFTIGKSLRSGSTTTCLPPGPGAYKVPVMFADVPKYLLPNRSLQYV